ncbi:MAG: HD domain-containing protein [Candidatus ainarchaeum sp.]|nr:HD domain-containing protein [Candidatus ainarchaeum sp.]
MTVIRDAIHGNITLSEAEKGVVDCADFQRLRRIRQLALAYLVYPGAMHTRFEHSLGTMHLASGICDVLGISGGEKEKIRMAALLHDLGHVAFSHESEYALKGHLGTHEEVGRRKASSGEIGDIIGENFSAKEILSGKGIMEEINACDIGADRMDYLKRDAHSTGVAYGVIDTDRLIHTMIGCGGKICVERGGLEAAESLLIGRFLMFSTVYMHKTVRIASAMLDRAIRGAVGAGGLEPEAFLSAGDEEMLLRLVAAVGRAPYAEAIINRRFYKQALEVSDLHPLLREPEKAEKELSEKCGCDIMIGMPNMPAKPPEFGVRGKEGMQDIMEASELVSALLAAEERRRNAVIMCPGDVRAKVEKEAKGYFGQ